MKYRIGWRSKITGHTGHGETSYTKEQAEAIAELLNESDTGKILAHFIIPVEDKTTDEVDRNQS